ncbi:MAG: response regulator [Flavobacterium sp. BFFFF1]|uniref:response regulator n=1 Tax=Flavobacterium sp. BFFFF1 TaxID=2015557 RepID=UPI000BC48B16|nr:response regulator [Flavobacterium sp. BFFFF1]OYU81993.1 MAG: response regulator [Flavobacterium sp. BFFFF1]
MNKYKDVFVVDDDKIYHFIFKNLLHKLGINVKPSFFVNGLDALEGLRQRLEQGNFPDLILLDINMPIMNGWQFLDEFRKLKLAHDLHTNVYVITSSNDGTDISKAKEAADEIVNYFLKPIDEKDIAKIFSQ